MKKFLPSVLPLLLLSSIAGAQNLKSDFYNFIYRNDEKAAGKQLPAVAYRKNGVKSVEMKNYSSKNIYKSGFKSYFTPYETFAGYSIIDKKGNATFSNFRHFIDSVHYDKLYSIHKKDTSLFQYQFDNNMNVVKITGKYNEKQWKGITQNTYNDKNQLTAMEFYFKGKKEYRYEYDYFDNGSRKETRYFNTKGKLKQVWNYACTQQGDLQKSIVQTSYCKKRDYNTDGSYYETFEGSDSKGHAMRMVNKYSKDSLQLESREFNKKGQEISARVSEYDSQRREVKATYYSHGKLRDSSIYKYNDKGLVATEQETTARGKIYNRTYSYTYY